VTADGDDHGQRSGGDGDAVADTGTASEDGGVISGNVLTTTAWIRTRAETCSGVQRRYVHQRQCATVTLDAAGTTPIRRPIRGRVLAPGSYTDTFSYTMADSHGTVDPDGDDHGQRPAETVTAVADTGTASEDGGVISGNVLTNDSVIRTTAEHVVASAVGTFTSDNGATVT